MSHSTFPVPLHTLRTSLQTILRTTTAPLPATPRVAPRKTSPPPPLEASLGPLFRANPPQGDLEASLLRRKKDEGKSLPQNFI